MVSSYLERPLRSMNQVLDEQASRRAPTPGAGYADSHESGPDSAGLSTGSQVENSGQNAIAGRQHAA